MGKQKTLGEQSVVSYKTEWRWTTKTYQREKPLNKQEARAKSSGGSGDNQKVQ
jgi:hypothetical protein